MASKHLAFIREAECIGCSKCIDVCPVDAILGRTQQMHTVIADECIGCELCLPPCPVDCIDLIPMETPRDKSHTQYRIRIRTERRNQPIFSSLTTQPKDYLADLMKRKNKKKNE